MQQCCRTGQGSERLTRPVLRLTGLTLPAGLLVLLPKCPLCLAGWFTVVTGVEFSADRAGWLRASVLVLWGATLVAVIRSRRERRVRLAR